MTSNSPSRSFKDYESDADALMDELFQDVERSFTGKAALPDPEGESVQHSKPSRRSRTPAFPLGALAIGGLAALAGTVLWWSYVHLPKRLAILSGQSTQNSSVVANSSGAGADGTAASDVEGDTASGDSLTALDNSETSSTNLVTEAVGGVVGDAGEASADAASGAISATSSSNASSPTALDPPISDIEVDQAEVDRILAQTAPPPVQPIPPAPAPVAYAPPPPAPAPPPAAPEMNLVGVMDGSNGDAVALMMVGNIMRQVAVGETVTGGWRVASIDARSVNVTNGAQSEVLGF